MDQWKQPSPVGTTLGTVAGQPLSRPIMDDSLLFYRAGSVWAEASERWTIGWNECKAVMASTTAVSAVRHCISSLLCYIDRRCCRHKNARHSTCGVFFSVVSSLLNSFYVFYFILFYICGRLYIRWYFDCCMQQSTVKLYKQEAKVIWQRLHRLTPAKWSRVQPHDRQIDGWTDWQTDTTHIGNNSLHLMHSMQPLWRPIQSIRIPYVAELLQG